MPLAFQRTQTLPDAPVQEMWCPSLGGGFWGVREGKRGRGDAQGTAVCGEGALGPGSFPPTSTWRNWVPHASPAMLPLLR